MEKSLNGITLQMRHPLHMSKHFIYPFKIAENRKMVSAKM